MGGGNDRAAFAASDLNSDDTIDGGAGTDTISVDAGDVSALSNANNFEILGLSGGSATIDNTALGFDAVTLESALGGATTLTGFDTVTLQATQADAITIGDVDSSDSVTFVADDDDDDTDSTVAVTGGLDTTDIEAVTIDTTAGDSFSVNTSPIEIDGVDAITASGSGDVELASVNDADATTDDVATVDLTGLTGAVNIADIPGETTYEVGNLGNATSFGAAANIDLGAGGSDDDFDGDGTGGDDISLINLTAGASDAVEFTADALGESDDILVLNNFEAGGDITDDQVDFSAFSSLASTSDLTFTNFNADTDGGTADAVAVTSDAFDGTLTLIGVQAAGLNDGDFTFA
jgi:hypothetical protein